jgi:hypothetical protein
MNAGKSGGDSHSIVVESVALSMHAVETVLAGYHMPIITAPGGWVLYFKILFAARRFRQYVGVAPQLSDLLASPLRLQCNLPTLLNLAVLCYAIRPAAKLPQQNLLIMFLHFFARYISASFGSSGTWGARKTLWLVFKISLNGTPCFFV